MNIKTKLRYLAGAASIVLASLASTQTFASGTAANTLVSNYATLNFSVGGVDQDDIVSSPTGNSDPTLSTGDVGAETTDFRVDRKLDVLVAAVDTDYVAITPGSTVNMTNYPALSFTVTNQSNELLDMHLQAVHTQLPFAITGGTPFDAAVNAADNFDVVATSVEYYLDDGGSPGVLDMTDTQIVGGVLGSGDLPLDTAVTVLVVADIPDAATLTTSLAETDLNGAVSALSLVAQVAEAGGAVITQDSNNRESPGDTTTDFASTAWTPATQQDVFADNAALGATSLVTAEAAATLTTTQETYDFVTPGALNTTAGDDVASNGQASAASGYQIATADISLSKTVSVVCDDINKITDPKAIPGAYMAYTITVTNAATAGSSATLTMLSDELPTEVVFDTGFKDFGSAPAGTCTSATDSATFTSGFQLSCTTSGGVATGRACNAPAGVDAGAGATEAAGTVSFNYGTILGAEGSGGDARTAGELAPGDSVSITFQAQVQ